MQRIAIAVLAPAVLAVACGGASGGADEVLTAEPYPREVEAYPLEDEPEADEDEPEADEAEAAKPAHGEVDATDPAGAADEDGPGADVAGPRPADAAAYVREHLPPDALGHDVLLVDETTQGPQLLLAVVTDDRRALLEAARWDGHGFERVLRLDAGPAESLGTLRTPRAGGQRLVALGLRHDGELRIGVWSLEENGLTVLEACPLQQPREVRRQGRTVEIGCHPQAGAEDRLVWHDGTFRSPEAASGHDARTERSERSERAEPPGRPERAQEQGPPDHAEATPRARQGRSDAAGGRSDVADGPPGTQGGGPRGR